MNDFSPEAFFGGVNYAFMCVVESIAQDRVLSGGGGNNLSGGADTDGSRRVLTGDYVVGEFIRWWQLENKAANTLYALDPATQARVMSCFSPRDLKLWTSAVFIVFVEGVCGGHVPSGQPVKPITKARGLANVACAEDLQ